MSPRPHQSTRFLELGAEFEGKYRIMRELGRGGFGMVYLAYQEAMDRHVAIKVLKAGVDHRLASAKERFLREVRIVSKLRHPNTVTIHDYGESANGIVYMVLEYIEGPTLKSVLKTEGAQDPQRVIKLGEQIARSLAEAHRHGVIHRDLKPANIMVTDLETEADFVKVLDFGIARLARGENQDLTSIGGQAEERQLIGTPRYMSPEQVKGEALTAASDIYSLGLILYEMLVGQPAVQAETTMGLITQQVSPEPLELAHLENFHPALVQIVRRCTAKPVRGRFQRAEFLVDQFQRALAYLEGGLHTPGLQTPTGPHAVVGGPHAPNQSWHGWGPPHPHAGPAPDGQHHGGQNHGGQHHGGQHGQPFGYEHEQTRAETPGSMATQQPGEPAGAGLHHRQFEPDQLGGPGASAAFDPAGFDDDSLPPPPDPADSPFAIEPELDEPMPETRGDQDDRRKAAEREDLLTFSVGIVKIVLFGTMTVLGVYLTFIIISTVLATFLDGQLRLMGALILAVGIPLLTALGENSQRERFEVVERPIDRVARVFIGASIFSFAACVLVALTMSGSVVYELRHNPNWFLRPSDHAGPLGETNRDVSYAVAEIIVEATSAMGIYEDRQAQLKEAAPPSAITDDPRDPMMRRRVQPQPPRRRQPRSAEQLLKNPPGEDSADDATNQGSAPADERRPSGGAGGGGDGEYVPW